MRHSAAYPMTYLPDHARRALAHLEEAAKPGVTLPLPIVYERIAPTRWEYKVVTRDPREEAPLDEEQLQALGAEGWLLASILEEPGPQGVRRIHYYFVRAAEDEGSQP
ncbi:MAG: hypothetical protein ABI068_05470 [Ktedonobacterales bacterium]